jgi:hypothetical protein
MMTPKQIESKKQGIVDELRQGIVHLQFKKVNGDLRNMIGTLNRDLIPSEKHPLEGKERKETENLVVLFDTEVQDWRSFRTENLVEYSRGV